MNKKQRIMFFFVAILISGCFQQGNISNNASYGKSEIQLLYKKHYYLNVHYPQGEFNDLNKEIKQQVKKEEKLFLSKMKNYQEIQKAEFNVKYETFLKDERYLSIQLLFYESIYQTKQVVKTIHYDCEKRQFFELSDIMEGDYLTFIAKRTKRYFETNYFDQCNHPGFKINVTGLKEHYDNFMLTKDKIIFYFEANTLLEKAASFSLTYEDCSSYTSLKQTSQAVFEPYEQVLNVPSKYIDPNKAMVALTFDDGPCNEFTEAILDCLKEHHGVATFYVLGSRLKGNETLLQRMILEGSEIGNHSFNHYQLTTLSKEKLEMEIQSTQSAIYKITGQEAKTLRPPYGSYNKDIMKLLPKHRIVTWTLDSEDWRSKNTKTIVDKVMKTVKDKDIILLHDLYSTSAQAAMILIPELIEAGYQLVNVSQLYEYSKDHQFVINESLSHFVGRK
ncbi:MAG: polysaccharide deacetylase family protein [Erysipelotrichaceae bacterium]